MRSSESRCQKREGSLHTVLQLVWSNFYHIALTDIKVIKNSETFRILFWFKICLVLKIFFISIGSRQNRTEKHKSGFTQIFNDIKFFSGAIFIKLCFVLEPVPENPGAGADPQKRLRRTDYPAIPNLLLPTPFSSLGVIYPRAICYFWREFLEVLSGKPIREREREIPGKVNQTFHLHSDMQPKRERKKEEYIILVSASRCIPYKYCKKCVNFIQ